MEKVEPVTESGCWLWTGTLDGRGGYGKIGNPQHVKAHRVSWELFRGPIPDGMCILHKCDIRCCVNPDHLFVGTYQDNVVDMHKKGRHNAKPQIGERHHRAKLNAEQVKEILKSKESQRALARKFKVSESQIHRIKRGHRWSHINGNA